jgi:hypothetical protein
VASPGLVERRTGAGGESSLTTLPQASFATVATRRRGEQSLTLHRPAGPPHVDYDPFDPIRQGIEGRLLPPCVSAVHARNSPRGAALIREDRRDGENLWGAFPELGNAPHKFHFRHFHSVPDLLNRAPRQRAMLTKDRVLLAPSHRASPRSLSSIGEGDG